MIEKISLFVVGGFIGMIATIIIFRKDIIQFINYHDGIPDIEDIEAMLATNPMIEKNARLNNLHIHLNRIEKATYPEGYEETRAEIVSALKEHIQQLNESAEMFNQLSIDIARESDGLKLK